MRKGCLSLCLFTYGEEERLIYEMDFSTVCSCCDWLPWYSSLTEMQLPSLLVTNTTLNGVPLFVACVGFLLLKYLAIWFLNYLHKSWFTLNKLFYFNATPPVTYGSSRARGRIRAAAEGCTTAMATLELSHICDLLVATLDP